MDGTNPYHVVSLRCLSGLVGACCCVGRVRAVVACCCLSVRASVLLRLPCPFRPFLRAGGRCCVRRALSVGACCRVRAVRACCCAVRAACGRFSPLDRVWFFR